MEVKGKYTVTVSMPALNEGNNLAAAVHNVLQGFHELGISGELIIVNDGSSDTTGKIAEKFQSEHGNVSVVHHQTPQGFGRAFWAGVQKASGPAVVMIPGDGENDAREILRHLSLLDTVDVVVPHVANPQVRSLRRRVLSCLFSWIINATFGLSLKYYNGTVLYRREILRTIALKSTGFFYQAELLIKTLGAGVSYAEVPYLLGQRGQGESKALTLKSLAEVFHAYIHMVISIYFAAAPKPPHRVEP